jgi:hypothetical protein
MKTIRQYAGVLLGCAALMTALCANAIAQPAPQGSETAPAQAPMGMRGGSMMGDGSMMGGGMGMGPGMGRGGMRMGGMGMGSCSGAMGGMGMMGMMKSDPKTMARMMELRAQMMVLRGEMMRMMGDAMIQRGKDLQKAK